MLYGSEVWWTTKGEAARIETIQNDFLRWVCGYKRKDRMHVEDLRMQVGVKSIQDSMCCRRLEWLGHLIRMDGNRLVSRVWGGKCDGKRASGRPRWMYPSQEAEDLARGGLSRYDALNREVWKAKVRKIGEPR